jgi:UrcA family protein
MQILKPALFGVALIAVPAFAQGESPVVVEGGVPTAIVSYADLDVRSSSGLATLNGRITRAASRLCFDDAHKDVATKAAEARCFDTAMTRAKPQVERAIAERTLRLASNGAIRVAAR